MEERNVLKEGTVRQQSTRQSSTIRSIGVTEADRPLVGIGGRSNRTVESLFWLLQEALRSPVVPSLDGEDLQAYFRFQSEQALRERPVDVIPADLWKAAYELLDPSELESVAGLILGAAPFGLKSFSIDDQEEFDDYTGDFYLPVVEAILRRAGARGAWQRDPIQQLARGIALTDMIVNLRDDMDNGRSLFPSDVLTAVGLQRVDLVTVSPDPEQVEAVKRVLWRTIVRARDAFAGAAPLVNELDSRAARVLRRWLLLLLEVLLDVEKYGPAALAERSRLSALQRARVVMQAAFGRTGLAR